MTSLPTALDRTGRRLLWPFLALLLVLGWSSGFVGIRYANEHASVAQVLFWRAFITGIVLLPFALLIGPKLTLRVILQQAWFGFMIVFLYLGGFALAIEQRVPTGLVALISDLVPLAIAVLSHFVLSERITRVQWAGTAIAIAGVIIVSYDSLRVGDAPLWAYWLTVASMMVFALATVVQKRVSGFNIPVHQSLCIQFLSGSVFFVPVAQMQGGLIPPLDQTFIVGIAWLVLIATFMCYAVYYGSLRVYSASRVSAVIYLSPPVTMLWAWALFSEPLTISMFAGLGATLFGVWLTSRSRLSLPNSDPVSAQ